MPSTHKFYEYYTLVCFSVRTERLALYVGLQFLFSNSIVLWLSVQGLHSFWRLTLPALFNVFAALALIYACWTEKSSYSLFFLVINGLSIAALVVGLLILLLLELDSDLIKQYLFSGNSSILIPGTQQGPVYAENGSADQHPALLLAAWQRQTELGFLLLLALLWMTQGVVFHYYRYAKLRKAERYEPRTASPPGGARGNNLQQQQHNMCGAAARRLQQMQAVAGKY